MADFLTNLAMRIRRPAGFVRPRLLSLFEPSLPSPIEPDVVSYPAAGHSAQHEGIEVPPAIEASSADDAWPGAPSRVRVTPTLGESADEDAMSFDASSPRDGAGQSEGATSDAPRRIAARSKPARRQAGAPTGMPPTDHRAAEIADDSELADTHRRPASTDRSVRPALVRARPGTEVDDAAGATNEAGVRARSALQADDTLPAAEKRAAAPAAATAKLHRKNSQAVDPALDGDADHRPVIGTASAERLLLPRSETIRPRAAPRLHRETTLTGEPRPAAEPTIHVTIGRVEVRAVASEPPAPRKARQSSPVMSLDEYLRTRAR